jgi:hypothetical protein
MAFYAGFDAAIYPGDDSMAWLKSHSNLLWCGYYLAPAPNLAADANSWRGRRAGLAGKWGMAPIYVGQQVRYGASAVSSILTFNQGCVDGLQAAANAVRDGFAPDSCLYLDWEDGGALTGDCKAYVSGWLVTVSDRHFAAGLYCSHRLGEAFAELIGTIKPHLAVRFWCYAVGSTAEHKLETPIDALPRIDPAGCGFSQASLWQREQNAWFELPAGAPHPGQRLVVDINTAALPDPGAVRVPDPADPADTADTPASPG